MSLGSGVEFSPTYNCDTVIVLCAVRTARSEEPFAHGTEQYTMTTEEQSPFARGGTVPYVVFQAEIQSQLIWNVAVEQWFRNASLPQLCRIMLGLGSIYWSNAPIQPKHTPKEKSQGRKFAAGVGLFTIGHPVRQKIVDVAFARWIKTFKPPKSTLAVVDEYYAMIAWSVKRPDIWEGHVQNLIDLYVPKESFVEFPNSKMSYYRHQVRKTGTKNLFSAIRFDPRPYLCQYGTTKVMPRNWSYYTPGSLERLGVQSPLEYSVHSKNWKPDKHVKFNVDWNHARGRKPPTDWAVAYKYHQKHLQEASKEG